MRITLLTIDLWLEGCNSLKAKRRRTGKIRDKFARRSNLAVHESGFLDIHDRSQWSILVIAQSQNLVDQSIAIIEAELCTELDAVIVDIKRERLY
ncbi:MAG: DUF503 family protein [Gammaproteobacteria bacterium]|nr:DUF503 family protein [Gammaproteobacteria bacterium]